MRLFLSFIMIAVVFILAPSVVQAEFCCERDGLFIPVQMPPEQERDCTGMLSAALFATLYEGGLYNCPIKWAEYSYTGREFLKWFVDTLGAISGVPPDPESQRQFDEFLDGDYIWRASLTLHNVTRTVEGWYEESSYAPGGQDYNPGYVEGDWTLDLRLENVHFSEVVETGSLGFSGTCSGEGGEAMKDLIRAYFNPIGETVYEYEQVPIICEIYYAVGFR